MRIDNQRMKAFVENANAQNHNIKNLSELEKNTLKVMSKALREGKASIEIKDAKDTPADVLLNSIEAKLKSKKEINGSSLIQKIVKVFLNIFLLRTSSKSVRDDVAHSHKFLTKNLEKLEKVSHGLKEKMETFEKLTLREDAPKESIQKLRNEIEVLSRKKARLENVLFPVEDETKAHFEEKQKAISAFKKEIPDILEGAKIMVPIAENKELLLRKITEEANTSEFSKQFEKDYIRDGIRLKMTDPTKGEFVGVSSFNDPKKNAKKFDFHLKGVNNFFKPSEQKWNLFAQKAVTQSPFNNMLEPLGVTLTLDENGRRQLKAGVQEYPILFNKEEKKIDAHINRDSNGDITSINVNVYALSAVQTGKLYANQTSERPIDTIGYIESSMSYRLVYDDKGKEDIVDLTLDHVFKEIRPERPEESPGYKPL